MALPFEIRMASRRMLSFQKCAGLVEEDRLDGLPSALLTRSFARQYAHALGLDKEALVSVERQIEELAAQIPEPKP